VNIAGVTLWGACTAQTVIDCDDFTAFDGAIRVWGNGNTIRNLTITGRRPGVWVEGAGRIARVQDVIIEGVEYMGMVSTLAGRLTAERVLVRDIQPNENDHLRGYGLVVDAGGFAQIEDSVFLRNLELGIVVERADVIISDTVIHDTLSRIGTTLLGRGINIQNESTVELSRTVVSDYYDVGIGISESTGTLEDVVIRDFVGTGTIPGQGMGLQIVDTTDVFVDRVGVFGTRSIAILVANATVSLTDLVVRDTDARLEDLWYGMGLLVWDGATATVTRAVFERNRDHGVIIDGATVDITDLVVRDTRERVADDEWGRGLTVQSGATVTLLRGLVESNLELGVNAWNLGTTLTARHLTITDTRVCTCDATTCPGLGGGVGLGAYAEAHIELTDFIIEHSALAGAQLADGSLPGETGGTIALHDGEISNNPIGVNIQTADFDVNALQDNVLYIDNDRNLDTEFLPVPGMGDVSM
jgi:hypothetical protein